MTHRSRIATATLLTIVAACRSGRAPSQPVARAGAAPPTQLGPERGALWVVVLDSATATPIPAVVGVLERGSVHFLAAPAPDAAPGVVRFPAVPAGSYTLALRRVGYTMMRRPVEIADGRTREDTVRLSVQHVPCELCVPEGRFRRWWRVWRGRGTI